MPPRDRSSSLRLRHPLEVARLCIALIACAPLATVAAAQSPVRVTTTDTALPARVEGWRFTVQIDASSVDAKGALVVDSTVVGRAVLRGPDGRMDILRSHDPEFPAGGWVASSEGGRTLLVVDPAARRFAPLQDASATREMAKSKLVNMSVSGLVVRGDTLGPCGVVDGHATTCYVLTRDYKVTVRYFFIRRSAQVREELKFWVANDLPGMSNPVARFLADVSAFTIAPPDAVVRARRLEEGLFDGVPLKLVVRETQNELGRSTPRHLSSVVTLQLSDIHRDALDPASFDIPTTYRLRKP